MSFEEIHPRRLIVAAHELGHAVAWHALGLPVEAVRLTGRGRGTAGDVRITLDGGQPWRSPDQLHAYLVGLAAGQAADRAWCQHTNHHPVDGASWDHRQIRRYRKHPWAQRWTHASLHRDAHRIIHARRASFLTLVPRLAETGRLPVADLPR